jgi:hypothetical protein
MHGDNGSASERWENADGDREDPADGLPRAVRQEARSG